MFRRANQWRLFASFPPDALGAASLWPQHPSRNEEETFLALNLSPKALLLNVSSSSSRRVSKALKAAGQERNLGEKSRGPKWGESTSVTSTFPSGWSRKAISEEKAFSGLACFSRALHSTSSEVIPGRHRRAAGPRNVNGVGNRNSTKMSERLDWMMTCWRDLPVAASRARDVCSLLVYLDTGSGTCYNGNAHSLLNYTASKFLHGIPTKLIQTPCCTIPWKSRSAPVQDSSAFFARLCSSRRVSVLMSASLHPAAGAKPMLCSNISCTWSTFSHI